MRVSSAIQMLRDQEENIGQIKMMITNFQKNDGIIFTSDRSMIELDTEVSILHFLTQIYLNLFAR